MLQFGCYELSRHRLLLLPIQRSIAVIDVMKSRSRRVYYLKIHYSPLLYFCKVYVKRESNILLQRNHSPIGCSYLCQSWTVSITEHRLIWQETYTELIHLHGEVHVEVRELPEEATGLSNILVDRNLLCVSMSHC